MTRIRPTTVDTTLSLAALKALLDDVYVLETGDTMTGDLLMKENANIGLSNFTSPTGDLSATMEVAFDGVDDGGTFLKGRLQGYFHRTNDDYYMKLSTLKVLGGTEAALTLGRFAGVSNLAKLSATLQPLTDNTRDLGVSAQRWRDLFLSRNLTDGTNSLTVANAKTAYDHSQNNNQAHTDYLKNNADDATTGQIALDRTFVASEQKGILEARSSSFAFAAGKMDTQTVVMGLDIALDMANETASTVFGQVVGARINVNTVTSNTGAQIYDGIGADVVTTLESTNNLNQYGIHTDATVSGTVGSFGAKCAIRGDITGSHGVAAVQDGMNAARFDCTNATTGGGYAKGFSGFGYLSGTGATGFAIGVAGISNCTASAVNAGIYSLPTIAGDPYAFLSGGSAKSRMGQLWITATALPGGSNPSAHLTPGTTYDAFIEAQLEVKGKAWFEGDLEHNGSNLGFFGVGPAAQPAAYTRNATVVEDRTLLASASATTTNNNNVLAALIADLQSLGIVQ